MPRRYGQRRSLVRDSVNQARAKSVVAGGEGSAEHTLTFKYGRLIQGSENQHIVAYVDGLAAASINVNWPTVKP